MSTSSVHATTIVPAEPVNRLIPVQEPQKIVPVHGEKAEKQEKAGDVQQAQAQHEIFNAGATSGGIATHKRKEIENNDINAPVNKKQKIDNNKETNTSESSNSSSSSSSSSFHIEDLHGKTEHTHALVSTHAPSPLTYLSKEQSELRLQYLLYRVREFSDTLNSNTLDELRLRCLRNRRYGFSDTINSNTLEWNKPQVIESHFSGKLFKILNFSGSQVTVAEEPAKNRPPGDSSGSSTRIIVNDRDRRIQKWETICTPDSEYLIFCKMLKQPGFEQYCNRHCIDIFATDHQRPKVVFYRWHQQSTGVAEIPCNITIPEQFETDILSLSKAALQELLGMSRMYQDRFGVTFFMVDLQRLQIDPRPVADFFHAGPVTTQSSYLSYPPQQWLYSSDGINFHILNPTSSVELKTLDDFHVSFSVSTGVPDIDMRNYSVKADTDQAVMLINNKPVLNLIKKSPKDMLQFFRKLQNDEVHISDQNQNTTLQGIPGMVTGTSNQLTVRAVSGRLEEPSENDYRHIAQLIADYSEENENDASKKHVFINHLI